MSDDGCVETYWCGKCPLSFDFCRCASVSPMAVLRESWEEERSAKEAHKQEDRYEHVDFIVKSRADGKAWFDIVHDYITQDCDSVRLEDDEEGFEQWTECSCGMETMSGMGGTLQQCFDHTTNLGQGIQPIDVARVIVFLENPDTSAPISLSDLAKVIKWARSEIEFEEYFENKEWEQEYESD